MSAREKTTTTRSARGSRANARRDNPNQLSFAWGGAREGAGRPAKGPIASERHATRPTLAPRFPVHVVARVDRAVRALGRRDAYATIQRAVKLSLARTNFRIVRLAIHAQRLELLVEADDKHALARGMQGFQVSAARAVNRATGRRGTVFPDRYRMSILRTRSDARAAVRGAIRSAAHVEAPVTARSAIAHDVVEMISAVAMDVLRAVSSRACWRSSLEPVRPAAHRGGTRPARSGSRSPHRAR